MRGKQAVPTRHDILRAAESIGLLDSGSRSVTRIVAMLCTGQPRKSEVARLVASDPGLCARVLRVANSAWFARQRNVTTIEQALTVLGTAAVKAIAAAACLDHVLPGFHGNPGFDAHAFVRHSQASAVASVALAEHVQPQLAGDAYVAGLLHNLGVAVQVRLDTHGTAAIIDRRRTGDARPIQELEHDHSVVGHERCVQVILEEWQLPPALVMAACHHHRPAMAPAEHRTFAALVALGAAMALALGETYSLEPHPCPYDPATMQILGISGDVLDQLAGSLPDKIEAARSGLLGA